LVTLTPWTAGLGIYFSAVFRRVDPPFRVSAAYDISASIERRAPFGSSSLDRLRVFFAGFLATANLSLL